jgi:hypothetical protein
MNATGRNMNNIKYGNERININFKYSNIVILLIIIQPNYIL